LILTLFYCGRLLNLLWELDDCGDSGLRGTHHHQQDSRVDALPVRSLVPISRKPVLARVVGLGYIPNVYDTRRRAI
jgi:hypothetical protein